MVESLGRFTIATGEDVFALAALTVRAYTGLVMRLVSFRLRFRESLHQTYFIAVQSLPVVAFCLMFISLMLILEFSFHMKLVLRQDSLVPAFSTVLMIRELGPVMTCLLLTSRVGAGIAAEIGSMRVTEQIDALKLLGVDPVEYLTIPRVVGCVIAGVSLSVISIAVAILAGASIAWASLGYSSDQFYQTMFTFARFHDLTNCMIKGAVFGGIIPIIASHQGFRCGYGSEGVGNAATKAVVQSTMLIIIVDFILTYLFFAV